MIMNGALKINGFGRLSEKCNYQLIADFDKAGNAS